MTLSNVRSINNKLDELKLRAAHEQDFRLSNIVCLTETWLKDHHATPSLSGFTTIRADRSEMRSRKSIGGGLCMFINNNWATQFCVREQLCTPDYEILTVSIRPFYLPREFGQVTVILAYVPGPNDDAAGERIARSYNDALARSADQPVFILGDFNSCDLLDHLPTLHQYVDCPTRLNRTLDRCYGNISDAYKAISRPPLGKSDHNVIHLLPKYRAMVKRVKPVTKQIQVWSEGSRDQLRDCLFDTDWDIFFDSSSDIEEITDTITSYIKFCEGNVTETKIIKIFPNKCWVSKEFKCCLAERKAAFISGDTAQVQEKRRELRGKIKKAKIDYKNKIEDKFFNGNARQAWAGLNTLMGREKSGDGGVSDNPDFINDLNEFYCRYDTTDDSSDCNEICSNLPPMPSMVISRNEVLSSLLKLQPTKSTGPDGLKARLLKDCAYQLYEVFTRLFQLLLDTHTVPSGWKFTKIRPLPKRAGASALNDFRPIAITSNLCKTMERVLANHVTSSVATLQDPLQFAYKSKRGTDDALLLLLNTVTKYLTQPKAYARVLFLDFSSAFNSMKIHILLKRLADLNINSGLILWIRQFLSCRPQRVCVKNSTSDELTVSTGCPQGSVLSPVLFSLFTNEFKIDEPQFKLLKYADDMALIGLLHPNNPSVEGVYLDHTKALQDWCNSSQLQINVAKTKELVLTSCSNLNTSLHHVSLNSQSVEMVSTFKYLGTILDAQINFERNAEELFKKCSQRLYLLRKLSSIGVSPQILESVYRSIVESVLTFHLTAWYNHMTCRTKNKLSRVVSMGSKIVGRPQRPLSELYKERTLTKARAIASDSAHPLNPQFELLNSRRRYRVPLAKKAVFKKSFVPCAVGILNEAAT